MNKTILGLLMGLLLFPGAAFAQVSQTDLDAQLDTLRAQLIALLMEQLEALQARVATLESVSETPSLDSSSDEEELGAAVEEPEPTIDVDISYSGVDFEGNTDEDNPDSKFVLIKVTGDYDDVRIHMWEPSGARVLGGHFVEKRELDGEDGVTRDVNNAPEGEYRWEVTARLGDKEVTETGTFVAE